MENRGAAERCEDVVGLRGGDLALVKDLGRELSVSYTILCNVWRYVSYRVHADG